MKFIGQTDTKTQQIGWLTVLLAILFLRAPDAVDQGASPPREEPSIAPIRIVDQYVHQLPSGKRYAGSEMFDVTVGPIGNELSFVPDTVNVSVGHTVRW